ncbi:Uncharacterised protein [Mycobacteroides abscessus subsp. abscessus]|uniref:hypothetical protein n=1 Tax=Mycobacteroides abscessus TaxID=36809 RepID=UPI00092B8AA3|nr:hypothetical protein [Mycobacteroides abscessus]MBE5462002.1 hypothetical protein [Mycobacteroides abscessus]MBN7411693.1 hypothetical protein [Mycobacteroides abscessus subsp. abscessus]MDM1885170.1 hypothetical protein [Mycobacteroides abscessus]MDM1891061.1 hypothetical protein [Mycobacteroides abscessus]MDO3107635.1 hypothetical protein [Mycobacteroides abscessus subsp. abscessus]
MSLEDLKQNAADGRLVLHLEDGAIDNILAACVAYKQALKDLTQDAEILSTYPLGFSEGHLGSGAELAKAFQQKASGGDSSATKTFKSHIDQVDEMMDLFTTLRRGYKATDANNANNFGSQGR